MTESKFKEAIDLQKRINILKDEYDKVQEISRKLQTDGPDQPDDIKHFIMLMNDNHDLSVKYIYSITQQRLQNLIGAIEELKEMFKSL